MINPIEATEPGSKPIERKEATQFESAVHQPETIPEVAEEIEAGIAKVEQEEDSSVPGYVAALEHLTVEDSGSEIVGVDQSALEEGLAVSEATIQAAELNLEQRVAEVSEKKPGETHQARSPKNETDVRRQMTRILYKLQDRSYKHPEASTHLLDKMTSGHPKQIEMVLKGKPIFHEIDVRKPMDIQIDSAAELELPAAFYENPTAWIEAQPNIPRPSDYLPDVPQALDELYNQVNAGEAYDVTKVKLIDVSKRSKGEHSLVVSKRINDPKEIVRHQAAREAGIPTPSILGIIQDHGNTYLWIEHIPSLNFHQRFSHCTKELSRMQDDFVRDHEGNDRAVRFNGDPFNYLVSWINRLRNSNETYTIDEAMQGERIIKKYFSRVDEMYSKQQEQEMYSSMKACQKELVDMLTESIVGPSEPEVILDFQAKLNEAGLDHKDLADRNIIIKWDFKQNRPMRDVSGKAETLLIDWEEK